MHKINSHRSLPDCHILLTGSLQYIPSFSLDTVFDSSVALVHFRNALEDGNYTPYEMMVHNLAPMTSDQHCRTRSWELVCIVWCRRTFLLAWADFFVPIRKPFSFHRDKLASLEEQVLVQSISHKLLHLFPRNTRMILNVG